MTSRETFVDAQKFIEESNTEIIEQRIGSGIDVNLKDDKGCSLLHIAAGNEADDMINILIANNSDENAADVNGEKPLIFACEKNRISNIRTLIEHCADVNLQLESTGIYTLNFSAKFADKELIECIFKQMNISIYAKDYNYQTPLIWACSRKNNVNNVATLLDLGVNITDCSYDLSVLHFAAKYADRGMIKFLIEHGISVNSIDSDEKTPLMWACEVKNNVDNVATLVECGADVNLTTTSLTDGFSALHYAAEHGDKEIIECLLNHISINITNSDEKTPLMSACSTKNNLSNIVTLIEHGADVNLTSCQGSSALHYAAKYSDRKAIECLLNHNIGINVTNKNNETPLYWACTSENNIDNVITLLEHGADVNVKNSETGESILHTAARFADSQIIKCLLDNGLSVNVTDGENKTPLWRACEITKNKDNVTTLLIHGADTNLTCKSDDKDATILHHAAIFSDIETVKCLLDHNVSVNAIDSDNQTPLMWAFLNRSNRDNLEYVRRAVDLLITHGADVKATSKMGGYSALHLAAHYADGETISRLIDHDISVNMIDNENKTPLAWAFITTNKLENVVALLERGADMNMLNKEEGASILHFAALSGNSEMVKLLLAHNLSVNELDNEGCTPLFWACESEYNVDIVKMLLEHGTDITVLSKTDNASALHYASKWSGRKTVKCLLKYNSPVNVSDINGWTPLMLACNRPFSVKNVARLLAHGADADLFNKEKHTALHIAAVNSDRETVKCLLKHGVSVNIKNDANLTPLLYACSKITNGDAVAILLEHGADVNVTLEELSGASALHLAAKNGAKSLETIKCLLSHKVEIDIEDNNGETPLMSACSIDDNLVIVNGLLELGADINKVNKDGASALHFAAKFASTGTIESLLDHGISVNVTDNANKTPLMWACSHNNTLDKIIFLASKGAEMSRVSSDGRNCLHFAAANSDENVLKYLIEQGISINTFTEDKRTPLSMACEYNKVNSFDALIKLGADVNAKMYDGCNILHVAARFSDADMIKYLVDYGLSVNSVDDFLSTPLHSACEENRLDNVKCLVSLGADVHVKTVEGWSLLHVAAVRGNVEMIQYLFDIGLDVNLMDRANASPLMWAQRSNQSENVALFNKLSSCEVIGRQDSLTSCSQISSEQLRGNKEIENG